MFLKVWKKKQYFETNFVKVSNWKIFNNALWIIATPTKTKRRVKVRLYVTSIRTTWITTRSAADFHTWGVTVSRRFMPSITHPSCRTDYHHRNQVKMEYHHCRIFWILIASTILTILAKSSTPRRFGKRCCTLWSYLPDQLCSHCRLLF